MDGAFVKKWWKWSQLVLTMVMVQVFVAGMNLLSKVVLSNGTFVFALMAYRHVVAAICVAPFAFYFERRIKETKVTWTIWLWLFFNALTGTTAAMSLFYYGLRDTTSTYAANFLNLIPIATFILSAILRIEKLNLKNRAGVVKCLGVIVCVGGAVTSTLYKGTSFHLFHDKSIHKQVTVVEISHDHWTRGTIFLCGSCLAYATWFIGQVKLMKIFPLKYCATMLLCIFTALQSTVIGLCFDTSTTAWRIGWNLQLVTIVYSGALATAATFCLLNWAISIQGPLYPPMFNPLSQFFVAIAGALLLNEDITTGILIGMVMIIVGLYSFLWGKRKERKSMALKLEEEKNKAAELTGVQVTASVIPTTSPDQCQETSDGIVVDLEEGLNRNTEQPTGHENMQRTMP